MVARSRRQWQTQPPSGTWQTELRASHRDLPSLCQALDLDPALAARGRQAADAYALCAPHAWLELIEPGNPEDPLLRQILPTAEETRTHPDFGLDPVGDQSARQSPNLLCKYAGRALLLVTSACAIHCRYCFRRHFPFAASLNHRALAKRALAAIAARPDIHEVILSGGDPLLLNDHSLHDLLQGLEAIDHVQRIRLHSRLPIALPSRIDENLCHLLGHGRRSRVLPLVLVVQCNHPRELGEATSAALTRLGRAGVRLLNQSVLLRGVNDSPEILHALSEQLFALGVMPYYLHQLDRVAGSAHFEVPLGDCATLSEQLRAQLPGYLLPRMVSETIGANSKTPLEHTLMTGAKDTREEWGAGIT
ncbi:EF-P beta-lysylation protein EpmB [Rhabdochromatium marinum]|uniref:EF-P beta-lysylation protein EpmB n=1 Tax=Rhabdochromatium marinum TaxID=48729 RepID=UPI0019081756|nr:EF-P beta-lysylation protein EpmB [Rhabdochromatium marinum]MBK1647083.1 EF-P beta-lysylation protein EpmB [Rhabdochromatium marinum]